jgi:hypothetical protein
MSKEAVPNVPELLARSRAAGVRLWAEGGALRFAVPSGALDPGLRADLVSGKAGLIAALTVPPDECGTVEDFTPEAAAEALGPWPPRTPELSA